MSIQQSYTKHALKSTHDFLVTSSLIKYSIWYQVASFHVHVTKRGGGGGGGNSHRAQRLSKKINTPMV
jgi:hypothetical protein